MSLLQAGSVSESCQLLPATGLLELRLVNFCVPQAGSVFTNSFKELGFTIVLNDLCFLLFFLFAKADDGPMAPGVKFNREGGKREGSGEGGGSQGELGEGPGVEDLQRCWGCHEQSYTGRI